MQCPAVRKTLGKIKVPVQAEFFTPGVRYSARMVPTWGCRVLSRVLLVTQRAEGEQQSKAIARIHSFHKFFSLFSRIEISARGG